MTRTTFVYANKGIELSNRINNKIEELETSGYVVINISYQLGVVDSRMVHYTALITYESTKF